MDLIVGLMGASLYGAWKGITYLWDKRHEQGLFFTRNSEQSEQSEQKVLNNMAEIHYYTSNKLVFSDKKGTLCLDEDDILCVEQTSGGKSCIRLVGDEKVELCLNIHQFLSIVYRQIPECPCKIAPVGDYCVINMKHLYFVQPNKNLIVVKDPRTKTEHQLEGAAYILSKIKQEVDASVSERHLRFNRDFFFSCGK